MATQFVEGQPRTRGEGERRVEIMGAGYMVEALSAAAAVVLAILGLAGAMPGYMVAIGTILLGAAFLFEGGAVATRLHRMVRETAQPTEHPAIGTELAGGMSAESLAGIVGIAFGILSLLGVVPHILEPVAMIVFGGGLLLGSAASSRLQAIGFKGVGESTKAVMREVLNLSVGGQVLVGVGAIVLGILALLGIAPMMLSLVAVLAVGCSLLFSGSAVGARALGILRHHPLHA
jgi:hypothetical protein